MAEKLWRNEFRQIEFEFEGRYATLVFPPEGTANKHWMLKTEYFGAFPAVEVKLLRRGYHLAYLKNVNRLGTDIDTDAKARFAEFLHNTYGLSQKCVPVGMSCGGLQAVNFAAKYPALARDELSELALRYGRLLRQPRPCAAKGGARCARYDQK